VIAHGGGTGWRGGSVLPLRPVLPVLGLLFPALLIASCTFERRADPNGDESLRLNGTPSADELEAVELAATAAVRTMELFRSSVASGDISRALALVDRDASLVDDLAGQAMEASTRGELLLELRRRHAEGLTFEVTGSEAVLLSESVALVLSHLVLTQTGREGSADLVVRLNETAVLVSTSEGWRIRHFHRSYAPVDGPPPNV
jgi:hypothetical protein